MNTPHTDKETQKRLKLIRLLKMVILVLVLVVSLLLCTVWVLYVQMTIEDGLVSGYREFCCSPSNITCLTLLCPSGMKMKMQDEDEVNSNLQGLCSVVSMTSVLCPHTSPAVPTPTTSSSATSRAVSKRPLTTVWGSHTTVSSSLDTTSSAGRDTFGSRGNGSASNKTILQPEYQKLSWEEMSSSSLFILYLVLYNQIKEKCF